jgi:DNA repair protein RadC
MNLSTLDQQQLEAIVLDPWNGEAPSTRCDDSALGRYLPEPGTERDRRIRHVLEAAHELLVRIVNRAIVGRSLVSSPTLMKEYLAIHFAGAERELFAVVFLDAQSRVIAAETLFAGTLTQTAVHPREIVRRALHHNAAGVVLAHNHPSGVAEPSRADEALTASLKAALALIDVRVLDHIVVAGTTSTSMAERGLV